MRDKEHSLLNRQIRGLQEDNERIARMYTLVQNVREGKPVTGEEVAAPSHVWEKSKLNDKAEQQAKKGWQVASEDLKGSPDSLRNTMHFQRNDEAAIVNQATDQKITMKRN